MFRLHPGEDTFFIVQSVPTGEDRTVRNDFPAPLAMIDFPKSQM